MPRRFNWKQEGAHQLVQDYLNGKIQSARQLYNHMRTAGLHISKNTVYTRVRSDLRKKRQCPRISLLAVPAHNPLKQEMKGNYRIPWQSQSVKRILDSYIIYKREKSLREIGQDIGTLFQVPPIKKEALKNHVMERRRQLTTRYGPKLKKFDRLNFQPTDSQYYDMIGARMCCKFDDWFNLPGDRVKWDEKYDEPLPERWFQTVRSQLRANLAQQQPVKDSISDNPNTKRIKKEPVNEVIFIGNMPNAVEPKILSKNFKIRLIRHERQKYRSFIVEENPNHFYHYVKNRTLTVECSECREQWRRYGESGQISRLVLEEKDNQCIEQISIHHHACRPRTEKEIRLLEVERNIGDALNGDDELDFLEKAEQMALLEINRIQAEIDAENWT